MAQNICHRSGYLKKEAKTDYPNTAEITKENTEASAAVFESHEYEGSAPETNSPPQLSDSLRCKNNREITHHTLKNVGGVQVHASLTGESLRGG